MPILRSDQRNNDALANIRELLGPDEFLRLAGRPKAESTRKSIWKDGKEPPAFDRFCILLDGMPMFERQVDAFDKPEMLRANDLFNAVKLRSVVEHVLVWGKSGGKGYLSAKFIAYVAYCVLNLEGDPATYMRNRANLDLAPGTRMDIVNVAPNEDLAKGIFFDYLKKFIKHPMFDPFPHRPINPGSDTITFTECPLILRSLHSRASGLDGFNLLCWVMDEADAFLDNTKKCNAQDIHRIFTTSSNSRFGPFAIGFVMSYPRTKRGFIMRHYIHAQAHPGLYYSDRAGTKAIRPNFDDKSERVQDEYDRDPAMARAMYECDPAEAESAFFEFPEKIDEAIDPNRQPVAMVRPEIVAQRAENGTVYEYVSVLCEAIGHVTGSVHIGVDTGHKHDAFTVSVMHTSDESDAAEWICPFCGQTPGALRHAKYERLQQSAIGNDGRPLEPASLKTVRCGLCRRSPWDITPVGGTKGWYHKELLSVRHCTIDGRPFPLPHVYEDLMVRIEPEVARHMGDINRTVYFAGVEKLIIDLVLALRAKTVRMDPWCAAQMLQNVRGATGCDVAEISMQLPPQYLRARIVKALVYNHLITLLPGHVWRITEWKELQKLGNQNKIDHPDGGSKDGYDANAIAAFQCCMQRCGELSMLMGDTSSGIIGEEVRT